MTSTLYLRSSLMLGFIIASIALLHACKDPNTISGPTITTGVGNGQGTIRLPGWNGVDTSASRTLPNGITISSLAVSGGNIGRIFIPNADSIIGSVHFHRITQSASAFEQVRENNELGITAFIAESIKGRIPKVEINVAERTFPVIPHFFQGINANGISGINGEFSSLFPGSVLPQGRLTANVYMDSLRLADNVADIPAAITVSSPQDTASITRSSGLSIRLAQPLNFSAETSHCEITLFSSFGTSGGLLPNIPSNLRRMAGSSIALTPDGKSTLIPQGAGSGGKVINKILGSGTQTVTIPAEELQALPAGRCLVCIVITSAKRILPQQFILASSVVNEFTITLR